MMKILLAVDGSDASMSAVAATAALPKPPGSTIEVVSVIADSFAPEGSPWPAVIRVEPPSDRERVRGDVRWRLEAIASRLEAAGTTVEVKVLEGRPASEIVIEASRFAAELIVVGARGLSSVRRILVGSVSSEVVDHAPCPVLVARGSAVERLVFATDGSPDAQHALAFIAESGLFDAAEIRVVSVVDPGLPWWTGVSPVDGETSMSVYADAVDIAEHRARVAADEAVAQLRGRDVIAAPISGGHVASTIVGQAEAWGADIIALGSRSMGTVHRWLIGSVSRAVLHHAAMSVLIVRPRTAAVGELEPTQAQLTTV